MSRSPLLRPFEIMKLIRDGVITEFSQIQTGDSRTNRQLVYMLRALEALEFITLSDDRKIAPTDRINAFSLALNLSLTQLTKLTSQSVVCSPIFGRPSESAMKSDIFVVMPFSDELKPVYTDHIRKVAEKLGRTVSRADDFFTANSIISDVWDAINTASVLVADCTGRSPNVFYEIGIAHTLGKSVVLIAQSEDDIPFDIKYKRTILYEFTPRGMQDFERALYSTIEYEITKHSRNLEEKLCNKEL